MATRLQQMQQSRLDKLESWRKLGIDPYPAKATRTHTNKQTLEKDGIKATLVGRIMSWRGHGKMQFADLVDESSKIQLAFRINNFDKDTFHNLHLFDTGDFIQVSGTTFTTKMGERTLEVKDYKILGKTIKPLPSKWHGLKDIEERYRKRYLDTILNAEVKKRLEIRSNIIASIRNMLDNLGFIEVETPTLQPIYGGGFAKPFVTQHHALDAEFYLRISDEMYLKRLIVGGFEKVYEITKVFRNEGIDHDHNPEFTMFEAQIAFENYTYGMDLVEEIFEHTAKEVLGTTELEYQGTQISVKRPWKRLTLVEAVKEHTGVDPLDWQDLKEAKDAAKSMEQIKKEKLSDLNRIQTVGEVMAFIFEETVEDKLIQPTIIYDYPIEVSPLAKKCKDPRFTQRFEQFAFGCELGNNYSELNDPIDLKLRFAEEKKREQAGFDEAHQTDHDYLEAIEHGFPPTCGIAIGIDRMVMLYTNAFNIKEVIAFPTLRPQKHQNENYQKQDKYNYQSKKIIAIVNSSLPKGKIANALGHMAFSAGHYADPSWMGESRLVDASQTSHTGIAKYPFVVLGADTKTIKDIVTQGNNDPAIFIVDYPQEMFDTGNDENLVKAMKKTDAKNMVYHGVLLRGDAKPLDKLTKGLFLYG